MGEEGISFDNKFCCSLDKETYTKLKHYSKLKDMYINRATKELLTKAIKLWEE